MGNKGKQWNIYTMIKAKTVTLLGEQGDQQGREDEMEEDGGGQIRTNYNFIYTKMSL